MRRYRKVEKIKVQKVQNDRIGVSRLSTMNGTLVSGNQIIEQISIIALGSVRPFFELAGCTTASNRIFKVFLFIAENTWGD